MRTFLVEELVTAILTVTNIHVSVKQCLPLVHGRCEMYNFRKKKFEDLPRMPSNYRGSYMGEIMAIISMK